MNKRPDVEHPHVLITGRQPQHYNAFSLTRRASARDAIAPDAPALSKGAAFIPFTHCKAAANRLTAAAPNLFGTLPQFKYGADAISRRATPAVSTRLSREAEGATP